MVQEESDGRFGERRGIRCGDRKSSDTWILPVEEVKSQCTPSAPQCTEPVPTPAVFTKRRKERMAEYSAVCVRALGELWAEDELQPP